MGCPGEFPIICILETPAVLLDRISPLQINFFLYFNTVVSVRSPSIPSVKVSGVTMDTGGKSDQNKSYPLCFSDLSSSVFTSPSSGDFDPGYKMSKYQEVAVNRMFGETCVVTHFFVVFPPELPDKERRERLHGGGGGLWLG